VLLPPQVCMLTALAEKPFPWEVDSNCHRGLDRSWVDMVGNCHRGLDRSWVDRLAIVIVVWIAVG